MVFSIIVAISHYVLFNLGLLGEKYKIFMEDTGSILDWISYNMVVFIDDSGEQVSNSSCHDIIDHCRFLLIDLIILSAFTSQQTLIRIIF